MKRFVITTALLVITATASSACAGSRAAASGTYQSAEVMIRQTAAEEISETSAASDYYNPDTMKEFPGSASGLITDSELTLDVDTIYDEGLKKAALDLVSEGYKVCSAEQLGEAGSGMGTGDAYFYDGFYADMSDGQYVYAEYRLRCTEKDLTDCLGYEKSREEGDTIICISGEESDLISYTYDRNTGVFTCSYRFPVGDQAEQ